VELFLDFFVKHENSRLVVKNVSSSPFSSLSPPPSPSTKTKGRKL